MNKKKLVFFVALLVLSILPVAAMAAEPHIGPGGLTGPFITCSGNPNVTGIKGCTSLCDVVDTFQNLLYFIINLALFVLAPIMFIYGAVQVFLGAANESLVSKGKAIMMDTVIGLVIILASFAIVNTFFYVIGAKLGGGDGTVHWPEVQCNPDKLPGTIKSDFYNQVTIPSSTPSSSANASASTTGSNPTPSKTCADISCRGDQLCVYQNNQPQCVNKGQDCGSNNGQVNGPCPYQNSTCVLHDGGAFGTSYYHCVTNRTETCPSGLKCGPGTTCKLSGSGDNAIYICVAQ